MMTRSGSVRFTLLVIGGFSKCGLFFGIEIGSSRGRRVFAKRFAVGVSFGMRGCIVMRISLGQPQSAATTLYILWMHNPRSIFCEAAVFSHCSIEQRAARRHRAFSRTRP